MTLERWQVWVLAGTILCAGLAVAGGAFLGGYALGDEPAPPPPTELAEKTYTVEDLEDALTACQVEGVAVDSTSVTLIGGDHSPMRRACFVEEMGAPAIAQQEYSYAGVSTRPDFRPDGGEYAWSNVAMSWEQTDEGRDVTLRVG